MTTKKLRKSLVFSDIHWGRRNSSEVHNTDCLNYIDWVVQQAIDNKVDNIVFMGDWFETRSSINIHTLNYAYRGMERLNALNIPIYVIVGNHDCYYKNSRSVHSLVQYKEFPSVTVVDSFLRVPHMGDGALMVPYAFADEYESLKDYLDVDVWFGHFEFQGFVITGQNHKMLTGPNPSEFVGPDIFSGHFHKRQTIGNVTYIGNTFPMDYSDAGDVARGCMIYDHDQPKGSRVEFINWANCPKYQRVLLSDLITKGPDTLLWNDARVRCYVDQEINYEESLSLKEVLMEEYQLREFVLEEIISLNDVARDTEVELTDEEQLEDVDHLVVRLLSGLQTDNIKPQRLIDIYNSLEIQE